MQTVVVSLVALGAFVIVARRLVHAIRPPKGTVACPSCASGAESCAGSTEPTVSTVSDVHPLVLVKSKSR